MIEIFIFGIFIGIIYFSALIILVFLARKNIVIKSEREETTKTEFSPLAWATTFFAIWCSLLTVHQSLIFAWVCFGVSVFLLISIYINPIYQFLSSNRIMLIYLPWIFIVSVAAFIMGTLLSLQSLNDFERLVALSVANIVLGIYLAAGISKITGLTVRAILSAILVVIFISVFFGRLGKFGIWNWPLIFLIIHCIWATIKPDRFRRLPLV